MTGAANVPSPERGRLSDLDQVAVRISHVTAQFDPAIDGRGEEFGALRAPLLVNGADVRDPDVQEALRLSADLEPPS
jgi:hypothetical protein